MHRARLSRNEASVALGSGMAGRQDPDDPQSVCGGGGGGGSSWVVGRRDGRVVLVVCAVAPAVQGLGRCTLVRTALRGSITIARGQASAGKRSTHRYQLQMLWAPPPSVVRSHTAKPRVEGHLATWQPLSRTEPRTPLPAAVGASPMAWLRHQQEDQGMSGVTDSPMRSVGHTMAAKQSLGIHSSPYHASSSPPCATFPAWPGCRCSVGSSARAPPAG